MEIEQHSDAFLWLGDSGYATWVAYEEMLPDGKTRIVYKRPPDRQANEYLINRIMGKPTDQAPPSPDDEDESPATDADGNTLEP